MSTSRFFDPKIESNLLSWRGLHYFFFIDIALSRVLQQYLLSLWLQNCSVINPSEASNIFCKRTKVISIAAVSVSASDGISFISALVLHFLWILRRQGGWLNSDSRVQCTPNSCFNSATWPIISLCYRIKIRRPTKFFWLTDRFRDLKKMVDVSSDSLVLSPDFSCQTNSAVFLYFSSRTDSYSSTTQSAEIAWRGTILRSNFNHQMPLVLY